MSEELFVQQTADDGTVSYVNVSEVEDFALPDELIESSAKFQSMNELRLKTVQESKKYKKRAQKAEADTPAPIEAEEVEDVLVSPTPTPLPSMDDIYAHMRERMVEEDAQKRTLLDEKNTKLQELLKAHDLGTDALDMLGNSNDPDALAKYLGSKNYNFGEAAGGETSFEVTEDSFAGVYRNLGLKQG